MKRVLPFAGNSSAAVCCIFSLLFSSVNLLAEPTGNYVLKYDAQNLAEYQQKWANIYGPLELAAGGSLAVSKQEVSVSAIPF